MTVKLIEIQGDFVREDLISAITLDHDEDDDTDPLDDKWDDYLSNEEPTTKPSETSSKSKVEYIAQEDKNEVCTLKPKALNYYERLVSMYELVEKETEDKGENADIDPKKAEALYDIIAYLNNPTVSDEAILKIFSLKS